MATLDQVIEHITMFVASRGDVPGAVIGDELRKRFPDFDYHGEGFRNLTDLLDRNAPALSIVGRSGLDFLWSSGPADLATPVEDLPIDEDELASARRVFPDLTGDEIHFDSVRFRNFKSLADVEVPLHRLTILVGANGVGKTSVLEGIFLLGQLRNKKPGTVFASRREPGRMRTVDASGFMEVRIEDSATDCSAALEIQWPEERYESIPRHVVRVTRGDERLEYDFSRPIPEGQLALRQTPMFQAFGWTSHLKHNARAIARASYSEKDTPSLRYDGLGLPSVLAHLAATDRSRLDAIIKAVHRVIPGVEDVRMPRAEVHYTEQRVVVVDGEEIRRRAATSRWGNALEVKLHGHWLPADLLSEGTLLTLGLMAAIHGPQSPPRMLLIDDIDQALHPNAQRRQIEQLVEIQEMHPSLQIVCTTHSPYVLDVVDAECVRVMRMTRDGKASCRRLIDHKDWNEWKESMSAGEFWSFVGEDWLEDDRAS